ncbi:MAG: SDR family oxidoreductase [Gemmatimonadaceae bacterium]|jgi:3-oxoacyl-[acyl-carrier protein] reductase|nr:SDR family oxidoreductase [Gemmatimonadaceae bacterium]
MELGLANKVVLVCGASRGIAYSAAELFAAERATLVIVSRNATSLEAASARLRALGAAVTPIVADLAQADGPAQVIEHVLQSHGRCDVLVTNTGGPVTGSALGHDWHAWTAASELLLRSAVELTRGFVPGMRERGWGRVIGITSIAVKKPVPSLVLSNSLRAAVTGFFRTLADEVAADGVTVNTVLPGYTATERLDELAEATVQRTGATRDSVFDRWKADTPAARLGTPQEVASAIVYLASVPAGFITGQAVCVDGGASRSLL